MSPEDAANFERTLELGKEIAKDLSESDILGRWMAHHISDLITRAESSSGPQAEDLRRETANTIIELWKHRAVSPMRSNPTNRLEPVLQVLTRLGQQDRWHFYDIFRPGSEPDEQDTMAAPMLGFALELEDAVRQVIRHIVIFAANEAADREAKWLQLSEHLTEDDQLGALRLIRRMERELKKVGEQSDADKLDPSGVKNEDVYILSMLYKTEARLEEIRLALEEALSSSSENVEPPVHESDRPTHQS
jgi:hypothetical protein